MSTNRPRMDISNRAKQFMPFDALAGVREALEAKEKIVVDKIELSEEYKEELDEKMRNISKNSMISVVFFENNEYIKIAGMVSRIDENARIIQVVNKKIAFDDIYQLELMEV